MPDYNAFPDLIDPEIIKRASKFGSAELADGMKGLGIPNDGCLAYDVLPIDEASRLCGTAATVETQDGDNFPIHVAIYQATEGYVLVIDGKNYKDRGYLGDLIGGAAKAVGVNGIVIDGLVRDRIGLKEMGLPVFSRGFQQHGPSKIGPGRINTPIVCAGVPVKPGDLVLGDADGVTVVPREHIEEVLAKAEEKEDYEKKRRVAIAEYERCKKEGLPLPQLAPKWVLEMLDKQ
ncbi:MAG: RraA family protein [Candidatus Ornithospirochaeta sp.]|nr:RraA family protein [Candidatus Ornithospirochaeta sp.]